jgi:hypothetical protein
MFRRYNGAVATGLSSTITVYQPNQVQRLTDRRSHGPPCEGIFALKDRIARHLMMAHEGGLQPTARHVHPEKDDEVDQHMEVDVLLERSPDSQTCVPSRNASVHASSTKP